MAKVTAVGTPPVSTTALPGDTNCVAVSMTGWRAPVGVTMRVAVVDGSGVGVGVEESPPLLPPPPLGPARLMMTV